MESSILNGTPLTASSSEAHCPAILPKPRRISRQSPCNPSIWQAPPLPIGRPAPSVAKSSPCGRNTSANAANVRSAAKSFKSRFTLNRRPRQSTQKSPSSLPQKTLILNRRVKFRKLPNTRRLSPSPACSAKRESPSRTLESATRSPAPTAAEKMSSLRRPPPRSLSSRPQ